MYSYCIICLNHSLSVNYSEDNINEYFYYCPCCDWESEVFNDNDKNNKT